MFIKPTEAVSTYPVVCALWGWWFGCCRQCDGTLLCSLNMCYYSYLYLISFLFSILFYSMSSLGSYNKQYYIAPFFAQYLLLVFVLDMVILYFLT